MRMRLSMSSSLIALAAEQLVSEASLAFSSYRLQTHKKTLMFNLPTDI